jgi:hypothetical protein
MKRSLPISIVILLSAGTAHAERERATALSVSGGFSLIGPADAEAEPDAGPFLGATLSWDRPPPEYPALPGYAWAGDLVPDVTLARAGQAGLLMTGVRLELDYAQREQGLLRVSARGSMWLAPRLAIDLETSKLLVGGEFGTTYQIGHTGWALGYWLGILGAPAERGAEPPPDSLALWDERPGEATLAVFGALTLSRAY